MFQFNIPKEEDGDIILNVGPWILDNQLLVLRKWYARIEVDDSVFNIWIQVWNLPIHWISKEAGKKIGAVFHGVKEVIVHQMVGKEGT